MKAMKAMKELKQNLHALHGVFPSFVVVAQVISGHSDYFIFLYYTGFRYGFNHNQ